MNSQEFVRKAKEIVRNYREEYADLDENDIYVVWLTKVLQNNKVLLSTSVSDGRYYEVTFDGDNERFYFDAYVKEHNEAIANND